MKYIITSNYTREMCVDEDMLKEYCNNVKEESCIRDETKKKKKDSKTKAKFARERNVFHTIKINDAF